MPESVPSTTEAKQPKESPYWMGRHKRGFMGSLALIGMVSTGLFAWTGVNKSEGTAVDGLKALREDRACVRLIDDKAGPDAKTAIVPLRSLTPQQQIDCRVDDLPSTVNVSSAPGYGPQLHATIVNPTVELPDRQSLAAATSQDLKDSQTGKWDDLEFDVGMGMIGIPAVAFVVTAAFSGDAFVYNHRYDTPHREQNAVSGST